MLRGTIKVRCPECKTRFQAPDIEYCATVETSPVTCPYCGHTFSLTTEANLLARLINKTTINNQF